MLQLTFVERNRLEWREVPDLRLEGDGEAIVRPLAVARCDLDLAMVRGVAPVAGPFAVGHEVVAEVVEVGDSVNSVRPGDRVVVPFQIGCGDCARCQAGWTGSCTAVPKLAAFGLAPFSGVEYGGALSERLRVPFADAMLVPIPEGTSPTALAATSDNVVDGYRTVAGPLAERPDASVLIAGGSAASVGLYAVAAARALGAAEVVYVDANGERLALAEQLGARLVDARPEPGLRAGRHPITVDASSSEPGLRFALASTDLEGTCTSVGVYFADAAMPLFDMYTRGVTFRTGRVHARAHLPAVLELVATGRLDLAALATRVADWSEAEGAWAEPATKLVVTRSASA